MKPVLAAAVAALVLAPTEAALAGSSCGSGDSPSTPSTSDSGSSSSDDSIGSSAATSSSAPACVDETDIVGYRRCIKYGKWGSHGNTPLFVVELGTAMRTFASPLGEATGKLSHDQESFTYRVVGTPSGPDASPESALVTTARFGFGLPRGFYIAAEGELGGLVRSSTRAEMTSTGMYGAPTVTPGGSLVFGALGVLGVRGDSRLGTFGVEVAGGVRSITYRYDSQYLACVDSTTQGVSSPILEARARAAFWLSPFVNVGATAGASVIDRAWMAGVNLGFVTQAFGGLRD